MCGIVGYVGTQNAVSTVLEGLRSLEYRGYDSAGIGLLDAYEILHTIRASGSLANLEKELSGSSLTGQIAIGHTRWATHGVPCSRNAHPHTSPDGKIAVVHNGIVENFRELRSQLEEEGYHFTSDTDTEVIVHLIHREWKSGTTGDLVCAIRETMRQLRGPSAIVVLSSAHPDRLIAARLGNAGGVAIGYGDNEMFIASDIPALLNHTRRMTFLENKEMAVITRSGVVYSELGGRVIDKKVADIPWDPVAVGKGGYAHFMLKEIFDQSRSATDTLRGRLNFSKNHVTLDTLNLTTEQARRLTKVTIVACGSSYYAGMLGKALIERLARLPVEVDFGSEFRYRKPIIQSTEMVLAITQSGETVDTLAAIEEAQEHGAFTASIVNVIGSQAARISDGVIHMHAGPEIGVATTKAFTASVIDLFLLAVYLGQSRGTLGDPERADLIRAAITLPGLIGEVLEGAAASDTYVALAAKLWEHGNFLYLGRGLHYPIALEGALKLKEISYIHAEGYPAGEMKHGPIALIDSKTPTVVIAPQDGVYDKMVSQVEQVKSRSGKVIAVVTEGDKTIASKADEILPIPRAHELLTPILAVLPLQLLSYEMAVRRGADVDRPRNLAKSVTVE